MLQKTHCKPRQILQYTKKAKQQLKQLLVPSYPPRTESPSEIKTNSETIKIMRENKDIILGSIIL